MLPAITFRRPTLEVLLASLAFIACGVACAACVWVIYTYHSPYGEPRLFPLPGLYLLELLVLCGGAVLSLLWPKSRYLLYSLLPWLAAGAFLAFTILGLWSVGLWFLPSAALLGLAGLAADRRWKRNSLWGVGVGVGAIAIQTAAMFALVTIH